MYVSFLLSKSRKVYKVRYPLFSCVSSLPNLNHQIKASDIAHTEKIYEIQMNSPLLLAINMMTSMQNIYRLTVVDAKRCVRGVLSCLRVLDVLAGRKGEGIKKRSGKGFEPLLKQPIQLFINEYLHKLSLTMPLKGVISYIMENQIGHIVLVDQMNVLRGVITEHCILDRLSLKNVNIKVEKLMETDIYSLTHDNTIVDAIVEMSSHRIRRLPILGDGQLKGVITATDILRHLILSGYHVEAVLVKKDFDHFLHDSIKSIDFEKPNILKLGDDLQKIMKIYRESNINAFPVLDPSDKMVGIVTSRDLVTKLPRLIGFDRYFELISQRVLDK